ncbi:MAG TPA: hypothetical protein VHX60_16990 [Acidobacteriaceae bacterium]|jgi:hypothetical protein|nr:hypothetical protein [Acidobacteriaceae bacterium]
MTNHVLRPLRRTITPYVGQTVILAAVTVFCTYVAFDKHQLGFFWAIALIWVLFALYAVLFGLRYVVLWDDSGIVMRASGLKEDRRIRFEEIRKVDYELASGGEMLAQARPFRRLVIHSPRRDEPIDISLRHFRLDDIDALMAVIQARRPDLDIPAIPA